MEVNKSSDQKICGNIIIDIKTVKNENKNFTFHCALCSTEFDHIQKFSKHLEEHFHCFDEDETDEHDKCPNLLFEPEEFKVKEYLAMETYVDPLETEKSEKIMYTIEEFIPIDVKKESEKTDSEDENCDTNSNKGELDNDTNYNQEAHIITEESPEYSNKLYSYIFKDLSSDELSDASNDEVFDEAYSKTNNTTTTNSEFYDDPLEAEKLQQSLEGIDEIVTLDVKKESDEYADKEVESYDINSKEALEKATNCNQDADNVIEETAENSDRLYAYIFKDLNCDEVSNAKKFKHDVNISFNSNVWKKRTLILRILPSLIQIYKKYDNLWQVDNISFGIKEKINEVYKKIVEELKLEYNINITLEDINYHINYINELFSKDKKQELMCKIEEKEFIPKYKHYVEMSFLNDSQGPFLCTICNQMLPKYESYCLHIAQHNGTQPFKCPSCAVTFVSYHTYLTHKKRHLGIYNFHCHICGKGYSLKNDLEWHITSHTGDKPYLCQICGRGFRARHGYVNHIRRHEQRFRYECHICKRGFNLLHALNSHVKSHLNIRDIICEVCGKGFTHKQYLRKHELIHGDVKKYKCNECGKTFFQACSLRSHRKNHHY